MRDQELHVKYQVPEATEVQKLEKKSLVSYIHIGEPIGVWREQYGPAPRIQLNDAFKTAQDIGQFVAAERDKLNESERALMTICLKADRYTTMGRITEIKQELRRANALKFPTRLRKPWDTNFRKDSFPKGMCQIEKFGASPFRYVRTDIEVHGEERVLTVHNRAAIPIITKRFACYGKLFCLIID